MLTPWKVLAVLITIATSARAVCLTNHDANTLATNFGKLISAYSEKLANQTLTCDFLDYSESVNSIIDGGGNSPVALLGPTFASRADYEALSSQQPSVPFQVKNVWFNCNSITVRWLSAQSPNPVVGITVFETVLGPLIGNPSKFLIKKAWSECDSVV